MLRLAIRGAIAGAAILGALIAFLGGATLSLLASMWAIGTLAVLAYEHVARRRRSGVTFWDTSHLTGRHEEL